MIASNLYEDIQEHKSVYNFSRSFDREFLVIKEDAVVRTPFYEFGSRDIFESIAL